MKNKIIILSAAVWRSGGLAVWHLLDLTVHHSLSM